jgi:glycerol uptake facilitator-like aquaporin
MKRLHVHVSVDDLAQSIRFYSALFATQPTVARPDYAKWMLEDPRVNFAISARGGTAGVQHLGIQAENSEELAEVSGRLAAAGRPVLEESGVTCCYARSEKQWVADPQGVPWETFLTHGESTVYGSGGALGRLAEAGSGVAAGAPAHGSCCALAVRRALPRGVVPGYLVAQFAGAVLGVWLAHAMFGLPIAQASAHVRTGLGQWTGEFTATFALQSVVWSCTRHHPHATPYAVACMITAAYWFTSSTSFANPAVTFARALSDTFAGIRPIDAPAFVAAQLLGAATATVLFAWFAGELRAVSRPLSGPDEVVGGER